MNVAIALIIAAVIYVTVMRVVHQAARHRDHIDGLTRKRDHQSN